MKMPLLSSTWPMKNLNSSYYRLIPLNTIAFFKCFSCLVVTLQAIDKQILTPKVEGLFKHKPHILIALVDQ